MSAVPPTPRVKLRSTSRRIPRTRPGGGVLEADTEPNMRLSRAILVMLLLHIIAIGGVCAFSLIKERNPGHQTPESAVEAEDSQVPSTASSKAAAKAEANTAPLRPNVHVVRTGETLTRIANASGISLEALVAANGATTVTDGLHPGQELKLPAHAPEPTPRLSRAAADAMELIEGKPSSTAAAPDTSSGTTGRPARLPADSGKMYTVGKGESPYVIARKLKVSYEALLKLNGIDDPKKLKPGQKLHVPAVAKPAAKH